MSVFVWGLYDDAERAEQAVDELIEGSFPPEEISVLLRGERRDQPLPIRHKTGATIGAALGATIGAAGAVVLAGIPGGLLASGPLLGAAQAAGAGALMGAWAGIFFWKKEVDIPDDAFERGAVLVGVTVPEGRAAAATELLRRSGPTRAGTSNQSPPR